MPINPILTEEQRKLASDNMHLVPFLLKKYKYKKIDEDMISDGYIGLIKAAATYNPSSGKKFSAYATSCILYEINRVSVTNNRKKRTTETPICSLNTTVHGKKKATVCDDDYEAELINFIPSNEPDTEFTVISHLFYQSLKQHFPITSELVERDITANQYAKEHNLCKQRISQLRNRERERAFKRFGKNLERIL